MYQLGTAFYELFTGRVPWAGFGPFEVVQRKVKLRQSLDDLADVPLSSFHLPPALLSIMCDCWAFEPSQRPSAASVHQRLQALGRVLDGVVTSAPSPPVEVHYHRFDAGPSPNGDSGADPEYVGTSWK
jgi:hypothetical protein